MKIKLIVIGKTDESYLKEGIQIYENRLKHYISFDSIVIPALKNTKGLTVVQQKEKEAELILKNCTGKDYVILLDERGKQYNSIEFSGFLEKSMVNGITGISFIIGGPYGVSEAVSRRANSVISFSRMTFSHQMIRLFFVEQLYRAMTILKKESYHHE
jgi:23S rRNA (pseudouridine1915-N3)-methyltransferase